MSSPPTVVVYRHDLLPYSETFVRDQALHLERYRPYFAGLRRVAGLELPADRTSVACADGPFTRWLFPVTGRWPRLARRLGNETVALVHAHFEGGGIAGLGLARALHVPLVVTCHGWDVTVDDRVRQPDPLRRRAYRMRRRALQRDGTLFIAVSEHIRRRMLARGYPDDRTVVHRIGVDCELFRPDPHVARERLVVFVGRLVEKKGCRELLEALSRASSRPRLVVIGDGPLREELEALASRVYPQAELVGALPHSAVREWLNRAMVCSVPTKRAPDGDMDGCSLVLLEAQAMDVPVVSFASGGTPEAVLDGETGLLVPEGDVDRLAEAMDTLFDQPALWRRLSANAGARVRRDLDLRDTTAVLETLYDRAVTGREPKAAATSPLHQW